MEDQLGDVDMDTNTSNTEMVFDNLSLTILKEFSNIANNVSTESFLETVPKAKLSTSKRVKWGPLFNCLKQNILDEMVQEMNAMWENEDMPKKLEMLEKQKEKFGEMNIDKPLWRPQLSDVKAQLLASDVANLKEQKRLFESIAKEYESRVDRLKSTLSAKRGYLKALQMDIQKYQKKNEDFISHVIKRIENHDQKIVGSKIDIDMKLDEFK